MKWIKVLSSTILASAITLSTTPISHAAPNQTTTQTVAFDASHGQTAGAADWVIDGGFSDYADSMRQQGYTVKQIDGESNITPNTLRGTNILVLPEANIPFKKREQQAMLNFVEKGGNIIFISDHYNADRNLNRFDSSEVMNGYRRGAYQDITKDLTNEEKHAKAMRNVKSSDWLSEHFGVRFRYNALGDLNTQNIVSSSDSFGITEGVHSVSMHAGSTLAITDPTKAKGIIFLPDHLSQKQRWSHAVDQGIYNGGGIAEGPYVAISKVGKGKAAFIGDSSLVEDSTPKYVREDNGRTKKTYDGFKEQDNSKLLKNITTWFGKQDHTPNLKETGIKLDQPTPLLNFEQPQHSTEPEKEPWSQPPSGYKWYDRSTFKLGSYGSTSSQLNSNHKNHGSPNGNNKANSTEDNTTENNHSQEDTNTSQSSQDTTTSNPMISSNNVQFHLPDNVSVNQPFNIQVELTNMAKNTTIDHLKLSVYQDGGRQLARFSQDGQTYDTVGYSQEQSVTTDDQGNATLTFTAKTSEPISGANIRLKQGSKTLATGSIQ